MFPGNHLQAWNATQAAKTQLAEILPACRRYLPEEEDASKKLRKNSSLLNSWCCHMLPLLLDICFSIASMKQPCSLKVTIWANVVMCQRQVSRQYVLPPLGCQTFRTDSPCPLRPHGACTVNCNWCNGSPAGGSPQPLCQKTFTRGTAMWQASLQQAVHRWFFTSS